MNYYSKVIDVVAGDHNWRLLCLEIAKKHPKSVVEAAELIGLDWRPEARELVKGGYKIQAIKHCRNMTGMGLHEAKGAVEAL